VLFAKLPLKLLLLLFFGLAFGASAADVQTPTISPENASQSQLAAQTTEIAELKKLLAQAADDKRKAEDDTRKAEITSLKEQVQTATNNSQKAADWWINATGVVLTIFGLLVTVVGVFAPWWFTRRQKQDLENQEIQIKEHLKTAESLVASMSVLESQGLTHVSKLADLEKAANTDPSKVSPGSAEALKVQNALAGISEAEQEKQPVAVRLKLNALEAQAKNKWLEALSFWQQLLDKQPENTDALIGLASAQHAFADQQSSPELQNKYYEFAIENFKRAIPKQARSCFTNFRWTRKRYNAAGRGGKRPPRSPERIHTRARATRLGDDAK
jgi:cytochrome c-type biogenesis protein CcmH/NrfG